jgi:signal transduction histidine kinase
MTGAIEAGVAKVPEDAEEAREVELAVLSHALRNLISSMAGNLERVAADWDGEERPVPTQRHVEAARRAASHMATLLAGLSDGEHALDRRAWAAAQLVEEAVELVALAARRAGVRITTDLACRAVVLCDRPRLLQVLTNLIGNAIKYSRPGGHVAIVTRARGPLTCFAVADDGPGIAREEIATLFDHGYRGLWIARRIVEAHGGRLVVESALGAGAVFSVTLPGE